MAALAALDCPVRVTGLVAAAENAISGSAMRPGDVIRHYGGRTTEVTNTDAEGRLVLADALAYAVDELEPDVLVDVATLTGAMKVALGLRTGGFFATDDALADRHRRRVRGRPASRCGGCRWPTTTRSCSPPRSPTPTTRPAVPGAITAALFLQHFTGDVPWAHLDIASVGDSPERRASSGPPGPPASAPALLLHWLENDPLAGIR